MFVKQLDLLLFLMTCHVSFCQRRIEGGYEITTDKPYVVYLVKAPLSKVGYDSWLCGGALVTPKFILTSAACVEDVTYLYAIAGYSKYVTDDNIEEDQCTRKMKKKIIFTCVPISYELNYDLVEKWANIDIALAKVESSYNFGDQTYLDLCSYIPNTIPINYDPKYILNDTDCIVMGWGSETYWRKEADKTNYNAIKLRYTPTKIILKEKCLDEYKNVPEIHPIITQYMLCTEGTGIIDDAGQPQLNTIQNILNTKFQDGCVVDDGDRRMGKRNCTINTDDTRRAVAETNKTHNDNTMNKTQHNTTDKTYNNYTKYDYIKKAVLERRFSRTRRNGICQNDHGGPLVSWVGSTEVLIGVASVFGLTSDDRCSGPSLHTSTESNAAFINCIIHDAEQSYRRSALCDSPPNVRGFDMVQNHISWKEHPAGPAENELPEAKFAQYEE